MAAHLPQIFEGHLAMAPLPCAGAAVRQLVDVDELAMVCGREETAR